MGGEVSWRDDASVVVDLLPMPLRRLSHVMIARQERRPARSSTSPNVSASLFASSSRTSTLTHSRLRRLRLRPVVLPPDHSRRSCTCRAMSQSPMAGVPFAADRGRDNRPGASPTNGGLVCDAGKEPNPGPGTTIPANMYSAQYPAATLAKGQNVRWRWPAKNHAETPAAGTVEVFFSSAPNQGDVFQNTQHSAQMSYSSDRRLLSSLRAPTRPTPRDVDGAHNLTGGAVYNHVVVGVQSGRVLQYVRGCNDHRAAGGGGGGGGGHYPAAAWHQGVTIGAIDTARSIAA